MAAPQRFVSARNKIHAFEEILDPTLMEDHIFDVFELFRSDRDALSLLAARTGPDWKIYQYVGTWADRHFDLTVEPMGGMIRAMSDDPPVLPTLDYEIVRRDLLDENLVGVMQMYYDGFFLIDRYRYPEVS